MRLARPSILWRFLSFELFKLLLITAAVLVTVIAFAITIKPLADGQIGPLDAAIFMALASVPMLQYALPFAAGFAATLVYHRLSQDNEMAAAQAGGISHRVLLAPALLAGLLLGGVVLALSDQAMPRLLRGMSQLIAGSAHRLISSHVQRGQAIDLEDGRALWADNFIELPPDNSGATHRFRLAGVVATLRERGGGSGSGPDGGSTTAVSSVTARSADVWLLEDRARPGERGQNVTRVVLKLNDFAVEGQTGRGQGDNSVLVYRVPSPFKDDPKYFTFAEMARAQERPETMIGHLDQQRRALAALMGERQAAEALRAQLAATGRVMLTDGEGRTIQLATTGLEAQRQADGFALVGGATVIVEPGSSRALRLSAKQAWLAQAEALEAVIDPLAPAAPGSMLRLRMENVTSTPLGVGGGEGEGGESGTPGTPSTAGPSGVLREYTLTGLTLPGDPLPALLALSADELVAKAGAASTGAAAGDAVNAARVQLASDLVDARRETTSKFHERLAAAFSATAAVLLGAIMGCRLRESLPLAVYLWSFLPALGAVLAISAGQRMTHNVGTAGLLLLYAGVVAIAAIALLEYRKLARH